MTEKLDSIKKQLSRSTTMPYGTAQPLTGAHLTSQSHAPGCVCCGPAHDGEEEHH